MTKYTYIQKDAIGVYVEFDFELDRESNFIGTTFEDYKAGAWVLLSEEQIAFRESNPDASVEEVFNMRLVPIPPEVARTLEDAIREKIADLRDYDTSWAVNRFSIAGMPCWITAGERATYNTSIAAAELLEEEIIEIPLAGQFFALPVPLAKGMLAQIQRYADKAAIVTARHIAAITALENIEAVDDYDFTVGYPEKLTFDLPA
ncbi:MAG: hypothetical protein LBS05_00160 [Tannerellaceae bacterium]|jgi:hypothetical protein|nr:hypothetical protein [Tannerellaceae bacterium]